MDTRSAATRTSFVRQASDTRILTALALALTLGCADAVCKDDGELSARANRLAAESREAPRARSHEDLLQAHRSGPQKALRVRRDPERQRLWILTVEHVYVYDTRKRALLRRIPLPAWSTADFICAPDLALDGRGAAFVSNNVQPRLLEIDTRTLASREHELRLASPKKWDIGFGALAFGSDGGLYALSAVAGALFRIDLASGIAAEMALSEPLLELCGLTSAGGSQAPAQPRAAWLCALFENRSRRIDVAPDAKSAIVTNESCGE